jgi:hypothetical protein
VQISLFDKKDLFSMNHARLFAILLFVCLQRSRAIRQGRKYRHIIIKAQHGAFQIAKATAAELPRLAPAAQ